MPLMASPTAGLMQRWTCVSARSASTCGIERVMSASTTASSIAFDAFGENIAVPWPFDSKYTPTSYSSSAAWCKCLTPVGTHAGASPSVCVKYAVDAPFAYAVCTTPTRIDPGCKNGTDASTRDLMYVAIMVAILSPSKRSMEPSARVS